MGSFRWFFAVAFVATGFALAAPTGPLITIETLPGENVRIQFETEVGLIYRLLGTHDLQSWSPELEDIIGTGSRATFDIGTADISQRFFPVEVHEQSPTTLTVMTYNLYVGTDVTRLTDVESPLEVLGLTGELYQQVQDTNFPERAQSIAAQIAMTEPDVIGLQEVATYYTQTPGDWLEGEFQPNADEPFQDFLMLLLEALTELDLNYHVAVQSFNSDAELPVFLSGNPEIFDLRLVDSDALLALASEAITNIRTAAKQFEAALEIPLESIGEIISFPRSYTEVTFNFGGRDVSVVNTHLEVETPILIQELQAAELIEALSEHSTPLVLLGDFNSAADGSTTSTYDMITNQGAFMDAFGKLHPSNDGFTCCQPDHLGNRTSQHNTRIGFVFSPGSLEPIQAEVIGEEGVDKTPMGLWPSDHAGVVATFVID